VGTTDETAQYLLSRLRATRKNIRDSQPDTVCRAHGPMAEGVSCLLECKELEIEAAQRQESQAAADEKFKDRAKYVVTIVISALTSVGAIKLFS
jgi:hypothetical protein